MRKLVLLLKNKVLFYLVSRYATYFVQFITSLIIAAKLGPYYMGIWGFVLLILNYFQQCHFGISYSFPVFYIHCKDDKEKISSYIINSLLLIGLLCLAIIIIYLYYLVFGIPAFEKYHMNDFAWCVFTIAILQHFHSFIIQFFRVKNHINSVAFCQSIVVVLNFLCIFFFEGEDLIIALLAGYVLGLLICIILFIINKDLIINLNNISISTQKEILKKGFFLFLYGSCFYFIVISIRTIISAYYSVEEFGLFTFSYTLAHAIILLLEAVSFLITPKLLSKLSSDSPKEVFDTIMSLRLIYVTSSHFLIYVALVLFPFLLLFFPKYSGALTSLNLIAVSILANSNVSGYAELLIAKNKEKLLSIMSSGALILNCILGLVLVHIFNVDFSYVILATLLSYLVYSFCVVVWVEKRYNVFSLYLVLRRYFPFRLFFPYIVAVVISTLNLAYVYFYLPLIIFLLFNTSIFNSYKTNIIKVFRHPDVVNV